MKIGPILRLVDLRYLALRAQSCPLCGWRVMVRLGDSEHAVRCPACKAGPAHMSLAAAVAQHAGALDGQRVWESSSRGAWQRHLTESGAVLTVSEYFEDVPPGTLVDGVQCQDVEHLTFEDETFDLATSTDVFEHVADDQAGFREVLRVLKPGGCTLFTVPIALHEPTTERATLAEGRLVHLLPPEYHDDHLRGRGQVLSFRTYGFDIVDRLRAAGFASALIDTRWIDTWFSRGRAVIVAKKAPLQELTELAYLSPSAV